MNKRIAIALVISTLLLSGCAVFNRELTPEQKAARANKTEIYQVGNQIFVFRYDEKGDLLP